MKVHKGPKEDKVATVMREFSNGQLKTPQGKIVTDKSQALAIALNAAGLSHKDLQKAEILSKTRVLKSELLEMIQKEQDASHILTKELVMYFKNNKEPKVEEVHRITDNHGIAKSEVETTVYRLLTSRIVHKDLSVKRGKEEITKEATIAAIDAIKKRVTVDTSYCIPYLAGYAELGRKIYIDKHLPEQEDDYPLWDFIIAHEATEKSLLDEYKIDYKMAHQIALLVEQQFVEAMGLDWKTENDIMQKYVHDADKEELTRVPADLDLTPYQDEKDFAKLSEMKKAHT